MRYKRENSSLEKRRWYRVHIRTLDNMRTKYVIYNNVTQVFTKYIKSKIIAYAVQS